MQHFKILKIQIFILVAKELKAQCHLLSDVIFIGVKLEKVHELFQVCRICGKGVVFYNMVNTLYQ